MIVGAHIVITSTKPEADHAFLPGGGKLGVYQPRHARPKL